MASDLGTQFLQSNVDLSLDEFARLRPLLQAEWEVRFPGVPATDQEIALLAAWLEMTNVLPSQLLAQQLVNAVADNPDFLTALASGDAAKVIEAIAGHSGGLVGLDGTHMENDSAKKATTASSLATASAQLLSGTGQASGSANGTVTGTVTALPAQKGSVLGGILLYTLVAAVVVTPIVVVGGIIYGGTRLVKKAVED